MTHPWLAERTTTFDNSGIRKVFDLASRLQDPINLSIGQPDFAVPEAVQEACIDAIRSGKNGYSPTQGLPILRDKLQQQIDQEYRHSDRHVFVSSGTSGALVLAILSMVNPGDEVLMFDPFFVMYEPLVKMAGGVPVLIDTYPNFQVDVNAVADRITSRSKMILLNSPANPTGVTAGEQEVRDLAELAARHNLALISDEIYRSFCYDGQFHSPAQFNDQTIVIDGFSKSHAMTGWRLGYAHGPRAVIETMAKLQQYTFVCAPQPAQWAGVAAMEVDTSEYLAAYRRKRDLIVAGLSRDYELVIPQGAFYVFPKAPWGSGTEFVSKAIENNVLIIPGNIFSRRNTHFRLSYAASDSVLERGIEALSKLARA